MSAALHALDPRSHCVSRLPRHVPPAHLPASGGINPVSLPPPSDHFRGKSVVDHLKEARTKGMHASHEVHGTEMPGHYAALADAAKETAIAFSILWILSLFFSFPLTLVLSFFAFAWALWKTGRSALLGWARMER